MSKVRTETTIQQRALIIQAWEGDENGSKTPKEISDFFKLNYKTVWRIIDRYRKTKTICNTPGRGRKSIFNTREKRSILKTVKVNPRASAVDIANSAEIDLGKKASPKTIRRILNEDGLKNFRAKKKPFISKRNIKKRMDFAKEHIHKDQSFWNKVLWSDESKFNVFGSDGRIRVWRKTNEALKMKNLNPTVKHGGGSVMVWGCFSSAGPGNMEFVETTMNQHIYQDILNGNVKSSAAKLALGRRYIFQQDNDPKHTAKSTWAFFKKNKMTVLDWPPQSPDLNPIEHLWDHIEREIRKTPIPNKTELQKRIIEAWNATSPEVTGHLVDSMNRRCTAVLEAKGGPTRY
ncbi:Transposable element Tcb1 transposase [Folsomia candida]|uniref:Transposable element Tcb1 transposase n=1 Tax=Folsomia candida TaxID=158441 RepID=A0A226E746_FOLCA|nr:Transposable element Tcb1 transposase [Folsomia candida]OXA53168.1 Transposable element Tcb1 transposase [Folsomia candida]